LGNYSNNMGIMIYRLLKKPSTALITQIRKNDYTDIYRYFKEF